MLFRSRDLRQACKEYAPEAVNTLLEIMRDGDVAANHRITAANSILDRGFGKPRPEETISSSVYARMSDEELIKVITGVELDAATVAEVKRDIDNAVDAFEEAQAREEANAQDDQRETQDDES